MIGDLIGQIEDLVDQGVLNKGQGNSLIVKLEGALEKLLDGKPHVAINRLNAFINEVNGLSGNVLPEETAAHLVMEAEIIKAAIQANMP
jgi:hypothetical protein